MNSGVIMKIGINSNSMDFGDMLKLVTDGKVAVLPECDCAEVVNLDENSFTVQGFGKQNIFVFKNGVKEVVEVDFKDSSVVRVNL